MQYQANEFFGKILYDCNLIVTFNMHPELAVVTPNCMVVLRNCIVAEFGREFYHHLTSERINKWGYLKNSNLDKSNKIS